MRNKNEMITSLFNKQQNKKIIIYTFIFTEQKQQQKTFPNFQVTNITLFKENKMFIY